VTLTTEAEHQAAVKEFRTLATDEEANCDRLLVLRDAIHAFEEAKGHNPGPPKTAAGQLQVILFKRHLQQPV
jgi:HTH-type transcriptional regulator/antitoxin HigA